jgi:hypothetical protein
LYVNRHLIQEAFVGINHQLWNGTAVFVQNPPRLDLAIFAWLQVCVYGYKVLLCASALFLKGPINGEVGNIFIGAFQKYRCVRTGVKYLQMYASMEIFNLIYTEPNGVHIPNIFRYWLYTSLKMMTIVIWIYAYGRGAVWDWIALQNLHKQIVENKLSNTNHFGKFASSCIWFLRH